MFRIIPRDTSFFDMFAAMSNNLVDAARALVDLFADYRDVDAKIEEIRRIEHRGRRNDPLDPAQTQSDLHHPV